MLYNESYKQRRRQKKVSKGVSGLDEGKAKNRPRAESRRVVLRHAAESMLPIPEARFALFSLRISLLRLSSSH